MKNSKTFMLLVSMLSFSVFASAQQANATNPKHVNQTNEQRIEEMKKRNAEVHAREMQLASTKKEVTPAAAQAPAKTTSEKASTEPVKNVRQVSTPAKQAIQPVAKPAGSTPSGH